MSVVASNPMICQATVQQVPVSNLQFFLLIGSAGLAIALLILSLTRLGHARPVMKCVVLSVIAHFLLLVYAYGTRLVVEFPSAEPCDPVKIHLSGYPVEFEEEPNDPQPAEPCKIDQFANEQPLPHVEELQRPRMDSTIDLERTLDDLPATEAGESTLKTEIPLDALGVPTEQPGFESQLDSKEFSSTTELDAQELVVEPQEIEFQRRGLSQDSEPIEPNFGDEMPENVDRAQVQPKEIEPKILNDNSFPDEQQRTQQFESEFVAPE
jgi:hypothetical protein